METVGLGVQDWPQGHKRVRDQPGRDETLRQINTQVEVSDPGAARPSACTRSSRARPRELTWSPSSSQKSSYKPSDQPKDADRFHFSNQPPFYARPAPSRPAGFLRDGCLEGSEDPRWVGLDEWRCKLGSRSAEPLFRELASSRKHDSDGPGSAAARGRSSGRCLPCCPKLELCLQCSSVSVREQTGGF